MADSKNLVLQLLITAKDEASGALKKLGDNVADVAKKALAFVGLGVSMQGAVQAAADFEEQLGKVAVKGGYSAAQMAELTKGVEAVATQFGVTGAEAAQGMEVLAAAGLSAQDAIATLPQVLALAKMEGLSLDAAATKLADDLSIMGMGFDQAGRMADVLAKGANLTTSSAASLSEALSRVGGQARAAGLDLEQTVAALDLLHKNGIKGSEAGTALAAILTQLLNPASLASQELNQLGISTRDLGGVLDGLQAAGSRAGPAILAFGEVAGPGLRALIGEGRQGLDDFTGQLRHLDGDALKAAQALNSNFNSAIKALGAAWDTLSRQLAAPLLAPVTAALRAFNAAVGDTAGMLGGAFLAAAALVGSRIAQLAAALPAWIAGLQASAAALSVAEIATLGFSRALAVLAGPVGLIASAVAGFLLFRTEAKESKLPLDALSGSVESMAAALKKLGDAQLQVAQTTLRQAIADQTAEVARLGQAAQETAKQLGQQVIVWDDWVKGAHYATVGQEQLAEANAKVEAASQRLDALTRQYNATLEEQARRAAAATAANPPHTQSVQDLSAAYTVALADVQSYQEQLDAAAPSSELAAYWAEKLAQAQQAAAAAHAAYLAALRPTVANQQQYAQTVGQAAAALRPYQELVDRLRAKLEAQQKAQQDTTATSADLKKALDLLAQQTNVYWTSLQRLNAGAGAQQTAAAALAAAYQQQAREVERLKLAQDGTKASADALKTAQDRLAALQNERISRADREVDKTQKVTDSTKHYTAALGSVRDAQLDGLRAEIQLAQQKGYTVTVQQKSVELAKLEARWAITLAEAKTKEIEAEIAATQAKLERAKITDDGTRASQLEIASLTLTLQGLEMQKGANQQLIETLRQRLQLQLLLLGGPSPAPSDDDNQRLQRNTRQLQQNTEALERGKDAATAFAAVLASQIQYWEEESAKLSEATKALFDYKAGLSALDPRLGKTAFGSAGEEAQKAASEIQRLTQYALEAQKQMLFAAGDIGRLFSRINEAGAEAQKAYYEQKLAAEQLEAQLKAIGETGGRSFASLGAAMQFLHGTAESNIQAFTLLNEQDLKDLRGALDDVNQKLQDMQGEAQSAKDRIAELNAEIAAERGDRTTADRLKLELEQRQALAEIEANLARAQAENNRELIALYEEQKRKLEELYALKEKNLAADQKQPGANAPGASSAKTYTLNLTGGAGAKLTTTTNTDPSAFLNELERAKARSLA